MTSNEYRAAQANFTLSVFLNGGVGHGFSRIYLLVLDHGAQTITFHAFVSGLRYGALASPEVRKLRFTTGRHNRSGLGSHFLKNYASVRDSSVAR